ncbi:MBL fold metallo-hydrolase [Thermodesulfobacteriota bacterium]
MKRITENVYVETGIFACNLGLITTNEGNILIDTPECPTDVLKYRDEVGKKGDIRYLINTEDHPDHAYSSRFFPGILITHQKTRETLANAKTDMFVKRMGELDPEGMRYMEDFSLRLADITFRKDLDLFLGGLTLKLFHLPGHSEGGIGVYIPEEKVVFTSDIVFHRKKTFMHEADPSKWLESLKRIGALDVDIIVPGHGEPCNKEYLAEQAQIVDAWAASVQSAVDKGLSLEEAYEEIPNPDPHPKQAETPMTVEGLNRAIINRLYSVYSNQPGQA